MIASADKILDQNPDTLTELKPDLTGIKPGGVNNRIGRCSNSEDRS
jgi:hypothetical protein